MNIIVICTGNSCRSQMAEGFLKDKLKKYADGENRVVSAGLETHGVNPRAVLVMSEVGIDLSRHTSDNISKYVKESFDYIMTVCDHAAENCPAFPGDGVRVHFSFDDPAKAEGSEVEILNEFRRVRDLIDIKLDSWLKSIL